MGAPTIAKEAKRVTTFCPLCNNQPALRLKYFKEIHKNKYFSYVYKDVNIFVNYSNQFFKCYDVAIVHLPLVAQPAR